MDCIMCDSGTTTSREFKQVTLNSARKSRHCSRPSSCSLLLALDASSSAYLATAAGPPIRRCSTPGPAPGLSWSASGYRLGEQMTPSRPWSEVGLHSWATGNEAPSIFNGVRVASSPRGSGILSNRLDR
jgi:hypothetical protein